VNVRNVNDKVSLQQVDQVVAQVHHSHVVSIDHWQPHQLLLQHLQLVPKQSHLPVALLVQLLVVPHLSVMYGVALVLTHLLLLQLPLVHVSDPAQRVSHLALRVSVPGVHRRVHQVHQQQQHLLPQDLHQVSGPLVPNHGFVVVPVLMLFPQLLLLLLPVVRLHPWLILPIGVALVVVLVAVACPVVVLAQPVRPLVVRVLAVASDGAHPLVVALVVLPAVVVVVVVMIDSVVVQLVVARLVVVHRSVLVVVPKVVQIQDVSGPVVMMHLQLAPPLVVHLVLRLALRVVRRHLLMMVSHRQADHVVAFVPLPYVVSSFVPCSNMKLKNSVRSA